MQAQIPLISAWIAVDFGVNSPSNSAWIAVNFSVGKHQVLGGITGCQAGVTGGLLTEVEIAKILPVMSDDQIAVELGSLGYPGFAYLAAEIQADQAEVLLDALDRDDLDVRVTEGLPWIPFAFPNLNWDWLIPEATRKERQNRLGFIVALATSVASPQSRRKLLLVLGRLERVKRAECDTLCRESMPAIERAHCHKTRSRLAAHWNLDTGMTVRDLEHLSSH